jgi:hypothetical protein
MYVPVVAMLVFHHKSFKEQEKGMHKLQEATNSEEQSENSDQETDH